MSLNSIVTEQDLNNLRKLTEQQKNQRAEKIKNRILRQTRDVKLAESLSPITKKLDESIKKVNEVIKKSNYEDDIKALPNSSKVTDSMREMLGSLLRSKYSLEITQDESGRANILGVPIQVSEVDRIKKIDNILDLTPQIYKALSGVVRVWTDQVGRGVGDPPCIKTG